MGRHPVTYPGLKYLQLHFDRHLSSIQFYSIQFTSVVDRRLVIKNKQTGLERLPLALHCHMIPSVPVFFSFNHEALQPAAPRFVPAQSVCHTRYNRSAPVHLIFFSQSHLHHISIRDGRILIFCRIPDSDIRRLKSGRIRI